MPPSLRSVQLMRINQTPYVCSSCRHHLLRQRIWQLQLTRGASSGVPFTERLRRKIWGTDDPPGLKDPYGGPSYLERRRQQAEEEHGVSETAPVPATPKPHVLESGSAPSRPQKSVHKKKLPPRSVPDSDPEKEDPDYVPAETWDDLEHLGSSGHWSEKPPSPKERFQPFLGTFEKASSQEEFLSALHQAVVEVVTVQDGKLSLSSDLGRVVYTPDALASISSTAIEVDTSGKQPVLRYDEGAKKSILEAISSSLNRSLTPPKPASGGTNAPVQSSIPGKDLGTNAQVSLDEVQTQQAASAATKIEGEQTGSKMEKVGQGRNTSLAVYQEREDGLTPQKRTPYTVTSTDFLTLPLGSLELRFRIAKRLSQLTGHRIPDPVLTSSETLMPIYKYLMRASTSGTKHLADRLLKKHDVADLPNVHVMARRETPVDKDKRFGRWKIIEAELQSKGLPVLSKSRA